MAKDFTANAWKDPMPFSRISLIPTFLNFQVHIKTFYDIDPQQLTLFNLIDRALENRR